MTASRRARVRMFAAMALQILKARIAARRRRNKRRRDRYYP